MVVAVSVVTSSMVESHASPCLCVDALPTTSVKITSGGDVVTFKNFIRRKHLIRRRTMELNSSFIDAGKDWRVFVSRSYKKQCRDKRVAIVNELGGQYDDTFDDVKTLCCIKQASRWEAFSSNPWQGATTSCRKSDGNAASSLW
ncbi:hypothetical protein TanjilG_04902 [Lupinus angustifolius]|uniref:Uncharacterized protein n=1 Tax=Lupinus angustifolius TaxID=3871 RepID=A0A1J7G4Z3_LUPAN|nr:hypothetical protein TanjilG_04902 [Lupinus angustifolius]